MVLLLDQWQKDFISCQEDKILVAGRQTGKSEAQAYDCGDFAMNNPNTTTLIISKTERQAQELLIKVFNYLSDKCPKRIGKGQYKPLKNELWVTHGKTGKVRSRVICKPVGLAGEGVRGLTIHKLAADEAQLITDDVFDAVTPMLSVTGGKISLTGTPQGKRGFFWKAFENKINHWKTFFINAEDVAETRPLSSTWKEFNRDSMKQHHIRERARMSPKRYAQEYLAQFVENLDQVFSDKDIEMVCKGVRVMPRRAYLGVDVGRTDDPTAFQIIDGKDKKSLVHCESIVRFDYSIPRTVEEIKLLTAKYNVKEIGVDGGGLGVGVVDMLMEESKLKHKTKDLNNSHRVIEKGDNDRKKVLLKEAMYLNLQRLMITRQIVLLNDEEVKSSLRSCQIEYLENSSELRIYGNDTHIVEGIIRACWLIKEQGFKVWCR